MAFKASTSRVHKYLQESRKMHIILCVCVYILTLRSVLPSMYGTCMYVDCKKKSHIPGLFHNENIGQSPACEGSSLWS